MGDTEGVNVSRRSTEVVGEIDRTGGCALKYSSKEMSKMKYRMAEDTETRVKKC